MPMKYYVSVTFKIKFYVKYHTKACHYDGMNNTNHIPCNFCELELEILNSTNILISFSPQKQQIITNV
jgi:hypothetical protein